MNKATPLSLTDHSAEFVAEQVEAGKFASPNDVVEAGLRLLEEREAKLKALRAALEAGERSGRVEDFDMDTFLAERHREYAERQKARKV